MKSDVARHQPIAIAVFAVTLDMRALILSCCFLLRCIARYTSGLPDGDFSHWIHRRPTICISPFPTSPHLQITICAYCLCDIVRRHLFIFSRYSYTWHVAMCFMVHRPLFNISILLSLLLRLTVLALPLSLPKLPSKPLCLIFTK